MEEIWRSGGSSITRAAQALKYRRGRPTTSPILYVRPHACVFITSAAARRVIHRTASLIQQADYVSGQLARFPIYDNAPRPPASLPALTDGCAACFYSAPSLSLLLFTVFVLSETPQTRLKLTACVPQRAPGQRIFSHRQVPSRLLYECKQHVSYL